MTQIHWNCMHALRFSILRCYTEFEPNWIVFGKIILFFLPDFGLSLATLHEQSLMNRCDLLRETVVKSHFKFYPNRTKTLDFRQAWVDTSWNRELRTKASITLKPTKLRGFLFSSLRPGWELTDCNLGGFRCYLVVMLEGKAIFMNIRSELRVSWMKEHVWTEMGQIKSVDNLETY